MRRILSIQSHVASGYVGNRAAAFPLQRLGHDVVAVNTVQFSNHTGYGDWTGQVFTAVHVEDLIDGLERRGVLDSVDALLTGYLGAADVGDVVLRTKARLPASALWLCDPVMGDVGRGFFVKDGIPDFFKARAVPFANIVTPNQFELEFLSGMKIASLDDAVEACAAIHLSGPDIVLVTSLIHDKTGPEDIQMLATSKSGARYLVTTPRLPLDPAPNGAGDVTAALFLAHYIVGNDIETALAKTAAGIFGIFRKTQDAGTRELALVAAQEDFSAPARLPVEKI